VVIAIGLVVVGAVIVLFVGGDLVSFVVVSAIASWWEKAMKVRKQQFL